VSATAEYLRGREDVYNVHFIPENWLCGVCPEHASDSAPAHNW
jgi:hypothetical protein